MIRIVCKKFVVTDSDWFTLSLSDCPLCKTPAFWMNCKSFPTSVFFSSDFTPFSLFPSKPAIKRLISLLPWKEVFPVFLFFPSRFHTVVRELIFPGVQFHFSSDLSFLTDCVLCPQSDKPTRSSGNDRLERNWKIFNCQIPTRGILNGQIFWSCWKQFHSRKRKTCTTVFVWRLKK